MKEFFNYFFGKGETEEFTNFTLAHFLPILVAVGIILLIWRFKDKIQACKHEKAFRYTLAFLLIVSEMSYYWRLVGIPSLDPNPVDHLPITVCGWAVVFCSFMVIGKSQSLFDIVYFWLFAGSIFALITPTVISFTGPTRFRYYQFWLEHTLGYISVFYMVFV
ncbi:MAG: YwaF family protein, partial [Clostridia bacterium]|nr:YwaF family protein [Clostridia bacterium]